MLNHVSVNKTISAAVSSMKLSSSSRFGIILRMLVKSTLMLRNESGRFLEEERTAFLVRQWGWSDKVSLGAASVLLFVAVVCSITLSDAAS